LSVNFSSIRVDVETINLLDWARGNSSHDRVWHNVSSYDSPCGNDRALPNVDSVRDDSAGTQPDIVFNHNALCRDSLLDERSTGIVEDMVDGNDLGEGRSVNAIANRDTALPSDHGVFTNKAVIANANAGLRQMTEVVHMQYRAMQNQGIIPDLDPVWARVKIHAIVKENPFAQNDIACESETDSVFNGGGTMH
jgi:hypothetical protein